MEPDDRGKTFTERLLGSLRAVAAARQTGTLTVRGNAGAKKLFFLGGEVLAVASAEPRERLGHYLVGWGFLTQAQLAAFLDEQRDAPRGLGELVVARRLVDRDAMSLLLRIRAEDALFDLVRWDRGECRFARDVTPVRDYIELRLPIEPLVADLERLLAAWRQFGVRTPGPQDVPYVERRSEFRTLSMREADVLRLVDGRRTLSEVAMLCRASQFEVLVTLQNHAQDGLVRFHPEEPTAASPSEPHWVELLREAENSLAFADLLEAYELLGRALASADTSRVLQEKAMAIERGILQRVGLAEAAILTAGSPAAESRLGAEEQRLVEAADGTRTVKDVLDLVGGDRMRQLLIAHSLVQHDILAAHLASPAGH